VEARRERLAWALAAGALLVAAAFLLFEGRGQTFFVDEWGFGYLGRQSWSLHALLEPDNGHLAVLPVVITKASLGLFGAATALPIRLVAVATHLATALMLFLIVRERLGAVWALLPTVLFLFLGAAADVLIGSHALPIELSAATGLGAWLALRRGDTAGDALAALLLTAGVASNGFALPFVAGAAAIIALEPGSGWRRQWVVAVPLVLYAIWRLTEGSGQESDFAFANIAGVPAFAFSSLAAELAAVTGLFTEPGGTAGIYQLGAGQGLAGALLVGLGALAIGRDYRPPRAAIPPLVALLALWLLTGMVASPARQPQVGRYVYCGVLLLLIVAATAIAASPFARRGALALSCVCAIGLIPNVDALHDAGTFFREQSNQNRAVLGAAALVPAGQAEEAALEVEGEQPEGGYADMPYQLLSYRAGERAYGTPALSLEQLQAADPAAREDADLFLARALPLRLTPAPSRPPATTAPLQLSQSEGKLAVRGGCGEFRPLGAGAQVSFPVPAGGFWLRPAPGAPVAIGLRHFADESSVHLEALPGQASEVRLPAWPAAGEWQAQLLPKQPVLVCGLPRAG
jgi:hypothetical protein